MTLPVICVVIAAASCIIPAPNLTLNAHHAAVAPVSAIIELVKSACLCSIASAQRNSNPRRALGPSADHEGNATAAASAAACASFTEAAGAHEATAPVSGSC